MELSSVFRELLANFGRNIITEKRLINVLADMKVFHEVPILREVIYTYIEEDLFRYFNNQYFPKWHYSLLKLLMNDKHKDNFEHLFERIFSIKISEANRLVNSAKEANNAISESNCRTSSIKITEPKQKITIPITQVMALYVYESLLCSFNLIPNIESRHSKVDDIKKTQFLVIKTISIDIFLFVDGVIKETSASNEGFVWTGELPLGLHEIIIIPKNPQFCCLSKLINLTYETKYEIIFNAKELNPKIYVKVLSHDANTEFSIIQASKIIENPNKIIYKEKKSLTPFVKSWEGNLYCDDYFILSKKRGFKNRLEIYNLTENHNGISIFVKTPNNPVFTSIKVVTKEIGYNVLIDDKDYGTTPIVIRKIQACHHVIKLKKNGIYLTKVIDLNADEELTLSEDDFSRELPTQQFIDTLPNIADKQNTCEAKPIVDYSSSNRQTYDIEDHNKDLIELLRKRIKSNVIGKISSADYFYLNRLYGYAGQEGYVPVWNRIIDQNHSMDKDIIAFANLPYDKPFQMFYAMDNVSELYECKPSEYSQKLNYEELENRLSDLDKIERRNDAKSLANAKSLTQQIGIICKRLNVLEERKFIKTALKAYYVEKERLRIAQQEAIENSKKIEQKRNSNVINLIRQGYPKKDLNTLIQRFIYFQQEIGKHMHIDNPLIIASVRYNNTDIIKECEILENIIIEKEEPLKQQRYQRYITLDIEVLEQLLETIRDLINKQNSTIIYENVLYTKQLLIEECDRIKEIIKNKIHEINVREQQKQQKLKLHEKYKFLNNSTLRPYVNQLETSIKDNRDYCIIEGVEIFKYEMKEELQQIKNQIEENKKRVLEEAEARTIAWRNQINRANAIPKKKGLSEFEKDVLGEYKRWV